MPRFKGETVHYVFRLSDTAKEKMDRVAPPALRKRSPFIREALDEFMKKDIVPLSDRPHQTGLNKKYIQVCATISPDIVHDIKVKYPDNSVSVVIQAAVLDLLEQR